MSIGFKEAHRALRAAAVIAAAVFLLGGTPAEAAEQKATQSAAPEHRVSPYAKYAREHAKLEEKKPTREKRRSSRARRTQVGGHGGH
jgi:hypothetical protein